MILLLDNYDSFTYNLVQRLGELDGSLDIRVFRNDQTTPGMAVRPKTYEPANAPEAFSAAATTSANPSESLTSMASGAGDTTPSTSVNSVL